MVKPAEKPATEPVVSSPRTTQTPTPTKARSSKLDKPLALMKTRPSTAGDSPAPSPHTPSSFTFTALSVSPRDPDQWEQRAKETRVVNEMLKESTARETLQDEIEDLKRMNETLRKKVQNAKNEDVGRVYLGDSTVSGLNEKKTPLTAKVDAYERKVSYCTKSIV